MAAGSRGAADQAVPNVCALSAIVAQRFANVFSNTPQIIQSRLPIVEKTVIQHQQQRCHQQGNGKPAAFVALGYIGAHAPGQARTLALANAVNDFQAACFLHIRFPDG